jgi:hypothetical protein
MKKWVYISHIPYHLRHTGIKEEFEKSMETLRG